MVKSRALKHCLFTALLAIILTVAYNETAMATDEFVNSSTISSYYSVGKYNKYYYNQLDSYAKVIYDKLLINADNMKSGNYTINIFYETATVREDEIGKFFQSAIDAFDRDHPEIFWLALNKLQLSYSILNNNGVNYVKNVKVGLIQNSQNQSYLLDEYNVDGALENDIELFNSGLNNIIAEVSSTYTYDTVKKIHDLLVLQNDYNTSDNMSFKAYKSISAILGNIDNSSAPVCEGYSRAFKVICDRLGIPCVIASGNASLTGESIGHMWNCVLVDSHWYFVDITWDDPILGADKSFEDLTEERRYAFFLIGTNKIKNTHTLSGMFADKPNYNMYFKYPLMNCSDYGADTNYYKITLKNVSGGTISTNADEVFEVEEGTQINVYVEPESGMEILPGSLKYNNIEIIDNSFIMPSEDVIITIKYMKSDVEVDIPSSDSNTQDEPEVNEVPLETQSPIIGDSSIQNNIVNNENDNDESSTESNIDINDNTYIEPTVGNTDDTKVTHKNNKTSKPSVTKDTNITNNSNGVLPIMKYKLLITNSSGISNDTSSIMQNEIEYNVSPTIFEEEVSASIEERMLDDTISNLLIKKFGKNTLLDTTIFELNIFNSSGEKVSFTIDEHEEFVVYIPVSEKFKENEDKIRLFNVTNEQLIVVNSRICVINDVLYFKIYFENPGVYVMVEDLGIIEKNDNSNSELINSNITNNNIPKDTESSSNNNQIYVAIVLLTVGIVTLIITMARKSKTTINNVEALSETIIEKEAENLS